MAARSRRGPGGSVGRCGVQPLRPINAVVTTLLERDEVLAFRPDHCAITMFEVGEAGLKLVELGPEAQTQVL